MVKLQDFAIAGMVFFAVIAAAMIFFNSATEYGQDPYTVNIDGGNYSLVNQSKIEDLTKIAKESDESLDLEEFGDEDSLTAIVKKAVESSRILKSSIGILYEFTKGGAEILGIPPVFITIIIAILAIVFVSILIALFTGRFV